MNIKIKVLRAMCLLLAVAATQATYGKANVVLTQEDFKYGTYIIDQPGYYQLGEDISFNPNSPATLRRAVRDGTIPAEMASMFGFGDRVDAFSAGMPLFTQFAHGETEPFTPGGPLDARYDPAAFGLGFFAAIAIAADGVTLDLNGHTIEQSAEHALLQRFFAVIELAKQPFIPGQGPHDFGEAIQAATNVRIKNGTIGRNSHHGIHGNANKKVRIINVDFVDYEVGAVALNGVEGLMIRNANAVNRKDVPILGTFSSAQFIKPYLAEMVRKGSNTTLMVEGKKLTAAKIYKRLRRAVNRVHRNVVRSPNMAAGRAIIDAYQYPDEYALFHNAHGVVDGNSYSFLVNKIGVAVNGFPLRPVQGGAKNIIMRDVHVHDQISFINEIVALNSNGGAAIDPVGSVWQILNRHPDTGDYITISGNDIEAARYVGNPVANAQAIVAKAIHNGEFDDSPLSTKRSSITPEFISWVEAEPGYEMLGSVLNEDAGFFCNGDSMFHVNKGAIAFKMHAAERVYLANTSVNNLVNLGRVGSGVCGDYGQAVSHPLATLLGYGGARSRGYTFPGSSNGALVRSTANGVTAVSGDAMAVDLLTDTAKIRIRNFSADQVSAGMGGLDVYEGANPVPLASAVHIGENVSNAAVKRLCTDIMEGFGGAVDVMDNSGDALVKGMCASEEKSKK